MHLLTFTLHHTQSLRLRTEWPSVYGYMPIDSHFRQGLVLLGIVISIGGYLLSKLVALVSLASGTSFLVVVGWCSVEVVALLALDEVAIRVALRAAGLHHARAVAQRAGPPPNGWAIARPVSGLATLEARAAAAGAADGKHRRYPASALPGGRLVPFSVETFGRWGAEAMEWLRGAVDAVAEVDPLVAAAGHWGKVGLLNAWQTRLSVALQKGNAACLLQAGRVRGSADLQGGTGWEEDIEDLLQEAAAGAGLGVAA